MENIIGAGNNGMRSSGLNVDLKKIPNLKCHSCGGIFFESVVFIKKISKIITGASEDQIAHIPILRCADCGEPLKEQMESYGLIKEEEEG